MVLPPPGTGLWEGGDDLGTKGEDYETNIPEDLFVAPFLKGFLNAKGISTIMGGSEEFPSLKISMH